MNATMDDPQSEEEEVEEPKACSECGDDLTDGECQSCQEMAECQCPGGEELGPCHCPACVYGGWQEREYDPDDAYERYGSGR